MIQYGALFLINGNVWMETSDKMCVVQFFLDYLTGRIYLLIAYFELLYFLNWSIESVTWSNGDVYSPCQLVKLNFKIIIHIC